MGDLKKKKDSCTYPRAIIGRFSGPSLAGAFTNPQHLDLFQIKQPNDGSIIFNVDYLGVAHAGVSPTTQALLGIFSGATVAAAFSNPSHLDLLQVIQIADGSIIYYVDYLGVNH
jgi:hypothetical protein